MALSSITLAAARKYTDDTVIGLGALKGAAAQIKQIDEIDGGHEVTYKWEDNAGGIHTEKMKVMDGVTPLVYQKCPNIFTGTLHNGDSFYAPTENFNRKPLDNDQFFTYLTTTSDEGIVLLYATVCQWKKDDEYAYIKNFTKIATTGLKALSAVDAVEHDLTLDLPFDLPLASFSRKPDGSAEECLIFDVYGHYRTCSVVQKDDNTVTVTPISDVVNINIGSVRHNHEQTEKAKKWIVQHNLNFQHPNVLCTDEDENTIEGDIDFKSMNLLEIVFCEPVKGFAYISK